MKTKSGTDLINMPEVVVQRRKAKQDRSAIRQQRITEGAILAISKHGIAGVTHRRVAQEAHVSLAATTYYYQTKNDIIADASRHLLGRYVDAFHRFADRRDKATNEFSLRDFVMGLIFNAAGKHSLETLAWCEIILNTAHQPELRDLSQSWFEALNNVWRDIAQLLQAQNVEQSATSAIDTVIGFLFLIIPLGLTESGITSLLSGEMESPAEETTGTKRPRPAALRSSKKAEETRERILNAAVEILIAGGLEALTFRLVAEKAGLTIAAPTYYFSSISALWNAAQLRLFSESKLRYRSVMSAVEYAAIDVEQLVDLTTTVFLREATEFRPLSLACYPVYIQSSRDPSLRPGLWAINSEQWQRWSQVLIKAAPNTMPFQAWVMYAGFTGKLIRTLATGVETRDLSRIRSEFVHDLTAMAEGQHWSTS